MTFAKACKASMALILLACLVGGCQSGAAPGTGGQAVGTKGVIGGLGGAAAGGLLAAGLGASPVGIAGSIVAGGLVGGFIGYKLDEADRREAEQSAVRALESTPSGSNVSWSNPDSGNSGTITPTRTYQDADGQYCREYRQTLYIKGEPHQSYGTACRQPDGTWQVMNGGGQQ